MTTPSKSLCLVVPKRQGEQVRRKVLAKGLLRTDLKITKYEDDLLIPISEPVDLGFRVDEHEFDHRQMPISDYKELVGLPKGLKELLPTSMDLVGDIAIIKLPEKLNDYKSAICEAIAKAKKLKTVALDKGVEGSMRLRHLELVVGDDTQAVYKEFGVTFELDMAKVYFSPRLSTERWRVTNLVMDGEVVIDMFSGIGPFSVMIAKHRNPKRIYALDINASAIDYLKRNIVRNRVINVTPILGDARDIIKNLEKADRIIMNLPLSSYQFFETALAGVKEKAVIHYYEVLDKTRARERAERLKKKAIRYGKGLDIKHREVKSYSSTKAHYAFDLEIRG